MEGVVPGAAVERGNGERAEVTMKSFALAAAAVLWTGTLLSQTQLTIYNQNFAAVKESRTLELKQGENEVRVTDLTAHLEPESVVVRDPRAPGTIQVLEQNYESDPLSEGLLLSKSEGKVIDFEVQGPQGLTRMVKGRILRSGYVPHRQAFARYGQEYWQAQAAYASPEGGGQPIVEVEGRVTFGLPGKPFFDGLDPKAFLKPTLLWRLQAAEAGKRELEFSYLSGGMRWEADYNAVAPEKGDRFDLVGWVTLENMSGKDFENASIKLMAGDVARAHPQGAEYDALEMRAREEAAGMRSPVQERAFEEYHLYTLERAATLLDREVKQVEFVRAAGVPAKRIYVYDGFKLDPQHRGWNYHSIRTEPSYGTVTNTKVWVMLEFENSKQGGLGMPLPKGKVKVYRRDVDGRNEFVGEDRIDHTPRDEKVRLYTGNAFDLVGERRQTGFKVDSNQRWVDESFEIKVRNHKAEGGSVRVVEHLYRWINWEITDRSQPFSRIDAHTVEFPLDVKPDEEKTLTYTVHYSW
jgi:hypothetical protein